MSDCIITPTHNEFGAPLADANAPNTTFPQRPGYQAPDPHPDDTYLPTGVTAKAQAAGDTVIERGLATIESAKAEYDKFLGSIPREHYSATGLQDHIAKFSDTSAAKAVDAAVTQVQVRADTAAALVDKIRKDLSPRGGDTESEIRATRYWNRAKALLDSSKAGPVGAAQNLITSADRADLGVLLEELPAYLQARGTSTDWIDEALAQAVPEYSSARAQLTQAQQGLTVVRRNAESLRKSLSEPGHRPFFVKYDRKFDPDK
jgi:hypothetical protein